MKIKFSNTKRSEWYKTPLAKIIQAMCSKTNVKRNNCKNWAVYFHALDFVNIFLIFQWWLSLSPVISQIFSPSYGIRNEFINGVKSCYPLADPAFG